MLRFLLRGLDKVSIETGLALLAHNLRKWAASAQLRLIAALLSPFDGKRRSLLIIRGA